MRPFAPLAAAALLAACVPAPSADSGVVTPSRSVSRLAHVQQGADMLSDSIPAVLRGKRVGLITNHTGHDRQRTSTIDLLHGRSDMKLVALFAPEHGIRGELDTRIDFEVDAKTGLPVHSLYGVTNKPTPGMLEGIEALVFDIADVGVRQYTYTRTMALAIQAAGEKGIPIVVLDRVNPIGGEVVEGNLYEAGGSGFLAEHPIASRHGLTPGELALLYNDHFRFGADVHVVRNVGWQRSMWLDDTDVTWTKPSPNLPTLDGIIHYPGTVFFEGTNLSEGRGSSHPFEQVGAPWLRADEVAQAMNALALPGVRFTPVQFDIDTVALKYRGHRVNGVRLTVTDRNAYRPVATAMRLIRVIREMHPGDFEWRSSQAAGRPRTYRLDGLAGSTRIRPAIEDGTLDDLLVEWERDADRWRELRRQYLLY